MSDDDFLIDDEIYALATTGDKKRKKRPSDGKASARKRMRTDLGASDMDESDGEPANPYPLEGKYKDAADRDRLNEMPEMQREQILAQRLEEMQGRADKANLSKFLASQRELGGGMADDSVAQAAKRKRTLTGSAKEKAHTRDALKANRKAKEERRATHAAGPSPSKSRRRGGSASSDMDTSSDEEGPSPRKGKHDPYEDSDDDYGGMDHRMESKKKTREEDKKITKDDLNRIQLTRTQLSKECMKPWFGDYVKGAWVRYLIGNDEKQQAIYRICEVKSIGSQTVQPYKLEGELVNQQLELAFGKSARSFNMDKVSNSPFTDREFNRLVITCQNERISLPTQSRVQQKRDAIRNLEARTLTENDVTSIINKRKMLRPQGMSLQQRIAEQSRMKTELNAAIKRNDRVEATRLRAMIEAFNAEHGIIEAGSGGSDTEARGLRRVASEGNLVGIKREGSSGDLSTLEELSRRNRAINQENARKLQAMESERRRKAAIEMKLQEEMKNIKIESTSWKAEQDILQKNPELAEKDIGTKMAHMVEIELPDF